MSRADLEGRFVKRFSARRFVALINSSQDIQIVIENTLSKELAALRESLAPNVKFAVHVDNEAAELAVITATEGKGLHRALYQQSRFFRQIHTIYLDRTGTIKLGAQIDAAGTAAEIEIAELDPFNQYVLLHFLPFVKQCIENTVRQEEEDQSRKALVEVVTDKLSKLAAEPTQS